MLTAREIGKRAQLERERAGKKQQAVADHFGINTATVSRWETGKTEMPVSQIIALARFYGCSPYAILLDPADGSTEPAAESSAESAADDNA
jgi:transcriptional regulator with XRE-family HTH domain